MSESNLQRLGPYLIEGVVGRGGMGSVFAARHEVTDERAAIKVLAPALASDETFRERFIAEIESLKKLNHPHIVQLHGYGEHDGHLYYSMELIDGTTLAQEISAGRRFSWREVTQFAVDISRALKHAHDHGVIHRDLKPANLLIDKDDHVKLTDFGIAKLFGASRVTSNGSVLGTADYMAPEQMTGDNTSPRCDLYSLGCVMYALLAGRPPFQGKSIAEVVHSVRYDDADPISKYVSDVPREMQLIIEELLEKDPNDRIRTALSLTHRLRAMQQATSITTTEQDDFTSDSSPGAVRRHSASNPPADIAERPTVCIPPQDETAADTPTIQTKLQNSKRQSKRDHFTRVELGSSSSGWSAESRNEYTSALPLMLLLLTVIGGLLGGVWYSKQPLSADALHAKIMHAKAADADKMVSAASDVNLFLRKFPDDSRITAVEKFHKEIEDLQLENRLLSKSRRRPETGSLSPIEWHCLEAFRLFRKGNVASAVEKLEGIQEFYADDEHQADFKTQKYLTLVERLIPEWEEKVQADIQGLVAEVEAKLEEARNLVATNPLRSKQIWEGTIKLSQQHAWARKHVETALAGLKELEQQPAQDGSQAKEMLTDDPPTDPPIRDSSNPVETEKTGIRELSPKEISKNVH